MRVSVLRGIGDVEVEERPVPQPERDEARIRIAANTWPTAIALVASGRVDLDSLVTPHFDLDDVEHALTAHRDATTIKAVIRPGA
jgi:L-iditol 2-dehydrogenase